jgi:hypothetical protein
MEKLAWFLQSEHGRGQARAQWAHRFGVTTSFIAHMLSGARRPSLATAFKIEQETAGLVTMQAWFEDQDGASMPAREARPA